MSRSWMVSHIRSREGMGSLGGGSDHYERVILEVVSRGLGGKSEVSTAVPCLIDVFHIRTQTRGD